MSELYEGPERRTRQPLSDDQIEHIAQRAAELAVEKVTKDAYAMVGKTIVDKIVWVIGVCAVSLFFYLTGKGIIK